MKLSVLTPASPNALQFIEETAKSVEDLRSKIQLEWILCIDGEIESEFPDIHPDLVICNPQSWGVAGARNLALSRASGDYIFPLDADDQLVSDGIIDILNFLIESEKFNWASGNRTYLDGSRTPHWITESYEWEVGTLASEWISPFPFHPNCIIFNRKLGLYVGGWPALFTNEDLGFVFALNRVASGVMKTDIVLRYRSWQGQTINSPLYSINKSHAFEILQSIENAWRAMNNLPEIHPPFISILEETNDR